MADTFTPLPAPAPSPRLWAALAAVACATGLVAAMHGYVGREIRRDIARFNVPPEAGKFDGEALQKLKGIAVEEAAFHDPAVLPIFGSSELTQPQPNRPDDFFRSRPTGFSTFVVAYPGETDLIVATKLAALGSAERGRKAVVFLSPSWFVAGELDPAGFGINFSPLQGSRLAFGGDLGPELRRDFARRLLDYRDLVAQYPLLKASLGCEAHIRPLNRLAQALMTPLGTLQNLFLAESDYAEVGLWARDHPVRGNGPPTAVPTRIDWDRLIRESDEGFSRRPASTSYSAGSRTSWDDGRLQNYRDSGQPQLAPDTNYARICNASKEWTDLDLLLRTAQELDIRLLLICQPLNENFLALQGLTSRSTDLFYGRLRNAVAPYRATLLTFPQDGKDPHFYQDSTHPSGKAWLVYDRALDAFYHAPDTAAGNAVGRSPAPRATENSEMAATGQFVPYAQALARWR